VVVSVVVMVVVAKADAVHMVEDSFMTPCTKIILFMIRIQRMSMMW
jgi:hypothetical protein